MLRKLGGDGITLRFCYEAGPCGYGIQRRLSTGGHECVVVAPSLIPKRAGDWVKTDRRDAASLAKLVPHPYGLTVPQVAEVYGVAVGVIERIVREG